jgi:hypothetical protein
MQSLYLISLFRTTRVNTPTAYRKGTAREIPLIICGEKCADPNCPERASNGSCIVLAIKPECHDCCGDNALYNTVTEEVFLFAQCFDLDGEAGSRIGGGKLTGRI